MPADMLRDGMITSETEAREYCAQRVTAGALDKLSQLSVLLQRENSRQNLVAGRTLDSTWQRHFADSLQLTDHVPRGTGTWLDLGSGGGFPGLVVAIARLETPIMLIESRKLRADWLRRAAKELELANVEVIGSRLESAANVPARVISARAFAPLGKLLSMAARFSTPDTFWVLPKGRSARQELQEQPAAVRQMFHVEQSLTDPEAGILIGRGVPVLR